MDVIYITVDEVKKLRSNRRGKGYGENDGVVNNKEQYEQGIGFPRSEIIEDSAGYGFSGGIASGHPFSYDSDAGSSATSNHLLASSGWESGCGDGGGTSDGFGSFNGIGHGRH